MLPVGGIKEKVLAARRAGIYKVILPAKNQDDLSEIPEKVKKGMQFFPVDTLDQVFELAIRDTGSKQRPKKE